MAADSVRCLLDVLTVQVLVSCDAHELPGADDAIGCVVCALNKPPRVAKLLIPFGGCLPPVFAGVGFALVQFGESA